ncbi:MAG TPA: hypothetical protein VFD26_02965 [Methyloceanibacter sp.]|nr:hypothetical protein [Methyloceanibacter sp.]
MPRVSYFYGIAIRIYHVQELMEDWDLAQAHQRLKSIEPLE